MPIGNPRWPPPQDIDWHWTLWENVQMSSSQKLQIWSKPSCTWMFIGWSSTNFDTMTCGGSHLGFPIGIKNRGPSNVHSWAVWFQLSKWFQRRSVGKCSNAFFSETTNMIKAKLYMNVHWIVLYKLYVFDCLKYWFEVTHIKFVIKMAIKAR
jgi:hypothetical protein